MNNVTEVNGIGTSRLRKKEAITGVHSNNVALRIEDLLMDVENYDFRPKKSATQLIDKGIHCEDIDLDYLGDAPDIGAYESGSTHYWIPGFQYAHASSPIPRNGAEIDYLERDLIWLNGWQSTVSEVYFGTDYERVKNASNQSPEFLGRVENNIYPSPEIAHGKTYYWRVDAVRGGKVTKGEIFSFSVE